MSEPNVDVVRRMFDAFAERDLEAMLATMDTEVEFLPVTANITTGGVPYRGFDGIERYLEDVARVWPQLRSTRVRSPTSASGWWRWAAFAHAEAA